jgi:geranylgeranyl reductase family protein
MNQFDVCIVGAGPAGSVAACLLARAGRRVALLERARFPRDKVCGDGITPRGARLLDEISLLEPIAAEAFACNGMTLRGSEDNSFDIDLKPDHRGPSALLVLPRMRLDELLLQQALATGLHYLDQTKVMRVEQNQDGCRVLIEGAEPVSADLVLLATGAESQLLRASGLLAAKPRLEHAARAYFEGVEGLESRVTLFFDGIDMPGYGWVFPTSATSANIGCGVFSRDGLPQLQRLRQLIESHPLLRRLLANARLIDSPKAYPLRTDFDAARVGQGRVLCLGEAAGLVNPITGEGIDYAFESARFAAAAILAPTASLSVLDQYRRSVDRRFSRRFRIYRWVQQNCIAEGQADHFLAAVKRSPALQQTVVNGLFGRARPADYFHPRVLIPALRLAMMARRSAMSS